MDTFENAVRKLVRSMYQVAGASITLMMLLTCADVLLRFSTTLRARFGWEILEPLKPIPGTYELVCLLGVVAAAFAMAHTSLKAGHVSVNFVVRLLSGKAQSVFEVITGTLGFLFFAMIGWQSIHYAEQAKSLGEVSMTLRLPYYPFIYGVSLSAFTVCLVLLLRVVKEWKKVLEK
ncbi:MAG: TRAP transporter small permease [Deltaproteobacteria bacterium]|nr:TRAP transporter small permease [Deltaproteobacteria bacterium]